MMVGDLDKEYVDKKLEEIEEHTNFIGNDR